MHPACQIEFEYGASGNTVRCGKSVAAECVDCGTLSVMRAAQGVAASYSAISALSII
jgi:hypothetical protein